MGVAVTESEPSSLRPRNISVPSCRPPHRRGCTASCARETQVRVRGSTREPAGIGATNPGARADVQSQAQGQGKAPMCSRAFGDAGIPHCQARASGWPQRDPVRPQAHLLPSLIHEEICPYRTPCHVSTGSTRHGPIDGLRRFTLCPSHVFSPSGPDIFGRPD